MKNGKDKQKAISDLEKSLGLKPTFKLELIKDNSGKVIGRIKFDTTAIDSCPKQPSGIEEDDDPKKTKNDQKTDMASYNAWLAAFNSMGNSFEGQSPEPAHGIGDKEKQRRCLKTDIECLGDII
ncbi:hypothetical protein SGGMMB4_04871 [Sodalis glossinidius str. 'morsitans']|uniref:Uncharacterized protein n=1 Tax=Sodalis glossinidius (strain morsitans) TaxID=343509 RepID=A0A193QML4_SODGM|nr:hypothetical protein [Sodalis glossinidius]CRL46338.1 hypothetical protein SGGMMB4_04871 [Sodalis glossinidius str. 'morsitans']